MTDSDTRAAPASAEGWLRRCVGVAVHRVGTVRAPSVHEMARRGRWLAFSGLAVDVTTLVDRGLLLLRPAGGSGDARGLGPSGPGAGRGRSARSSRGAPPPSALPLATPPLTPLPVAVQQRHSINMDVLSSYRQASLHSRRVPAL